MMLSLKSLNKKIILYFKSDLLLLQASNMEAPDSGKLAFTRALHSELIHLQAALSSAFTSLFKKWATRCSVQHLKLNYLSFFCIFSLRMSLASNGK